MAVFPEITPDYGLQHSDMDGVKIYQAESGKEYRRKVWARTARLWTLSWSLLSDSELDQLKQFYLDHSGRYSSFYFFEFTEEVWEGLQTDETGTGSLDTFTIPGKSCSDVTVYVDGVEETHWSLSQGAGANGEDQVVFEAGYEPAQGSTVTADFTGRRRYQARFNTILQITTTQFGPQLSVGLKELL